jgi:hypothetical protein
VRALRSFRIAKTTRTRSWSSLPDFIPARLRRCVALDGPVADRNYLIREFGVRKKTETGYEEDYRLVLDGFPKTPGGVAWTASWGISPSPTSRRGRGLQGVETGRSS